MGSTGSKQYIKSSVIVLERGKAVVEGKGRGNSYTYPVLGQDISVEQITQSSEKTILDQEGNINM